MGDRQTSGSITIDTTAIASAITRGMTPALSAIQEALTAVTAANAAATPYVELVDVLAASLPGLENRTHVAEHLAYRLGEQSYVLVHAPVPDLVGIAERSAGDIDKDTDWFNQDTDS